MTEDVRLDVPEVISEDLEALAREPRPSHAGLWFLAALGLGLLLAAQWAWVHREALLARWPQLEDAVAELCVRHVCPPLPEHRSPERLQVVSRSLLADPDRPGMLIFDLVFRNMAPWPQPRPWIGLFLSDLSGNPVAARWFAPDAYSRPRLPDRIEPGERIEVHLVMEAPGRQVVSYEIRFR